MGVSFLVDKDGYQLSDTIKRANIPNEQFQKVYTKEDTTGMLDKGQSPHPSMPNITFKTKGKAKLFQNLNKYKAAGPDSLPTFILKVAANEIAPVFTKIFFQKSYDTGTVPSDWRDANIVPI